MFEQAYIEALISVEERSRNLVEELAGQIADLETDSEAEEDDEVVEEEKEEEGETEFAVKEGEKKTGEKLLSSKDKSTKSKSPKVGEEGKPESTSSETVEPVSDKADKKNEEAGNSSPSSSKGGKKTRTASSDDADKERAPPKDGGNQQASSDSSSKKPQGLSDPEAAKPDGTEASPKTSDEAANKDKPQEEKSPLPKSKSAPATSSSSDASKTKVTRVLKPPKVNQLLLNRLAVLHKKARDCPNCHYDVEILDAVIEGRYKSKVHERLW